MGQSQEHRLKLVRMTNREGRNTSERGIGEDDKQPVMADWLFDEGVSIGNAGKKNIPAKQK